MRSSIKIPSHSERAVPFPRSSQTRERRRNISGRSGDPTSAVVTVREANKASVPHSGSCVSAVLVAGSISPRLLLPLRAPAALRALQYQLRFTVFIQRWRPSCSRRGRAQLSSNNSNTSTRSVRPPLRVRCRVCFFFNKKKKRKRTLDSNRKCAFCAR